MSMEKFAEIMSEAKEFTTEPDAPSIEGPSASKIGEGHLAAMARLGGHEITQALQAFPDSNIQPIEEPGVFGNPTPQIVTQEMGGIQNTLDTSAPSPPDQGVSFNLDEILHASPAPQEPPAMEQERGVIEM